MAKAWKDHFTNTYNGFEKTLRSNTSESVKELSLEEQMKAGDELVAKIRQERLQARLDKEETVRFGNTEYATYRANKDAIEAKAAKKGKVN